MKATVEARSLQQAVATVAPLTKSSGGVLPALSMIRLSAEGGHLTLVAGNLEQFARTTCPAEVKETGTILIPGQSAAKTVAAFTGDVELSCDGDGSLSLSAGRRSATLPTSHAGGYPAIQWPDGDLVELDSAAWSRAKAILHAASPESGRPTLCALRFQPDGWVVATDSYRLAWAEIPEGVDALVPRDAMVHAFRVFGDEVSMASTDNHAMFSDGETSLLTNLIHNEYPRWEGLVPKASSHHVEVDADALIDALAAAAVVADPDAKATRSGTPARFTNDEGGILVDRLVPDVGSMSTVVEATGELPSVVRYDARYLTDMLKATGGGTVRLEMSDNLKPMLLVGGDVHQLLMPIRVS